jgi:hypothetical protein
MVEDAHDGYVAYLIDLFLLFLGFILAVDVDIDDKIFG